MSTAKSIEYPSFELGAYDKTLSSISEKWLWLWEKNLIANGLNEIERTEIDPTKYTIK